MKNTTGVRYRFKGFPGSPHAWAAAEARALPPGPLRVLDMGAAQGDVGAAVREARREPVVLEGIEPDPAVRALLARRYDLARASLAERPAASPPADLALVLDVIEHVEDPTAFLRAIARAVRPGGTILISTPNVAHWSVRAALLAGRFDYAESGILDRTHLRFFTRATFHATLAAAGLTLEREDAAVVPFELLLPAGIARNPLWTGLRRARMAAARVRPELLAFQLLARTRVGGHPRSP